MMQQWPKLVNAGGHNVVVNCLAMLCLDAAGAVLLPQTLQHGGPEYTFVSAVQNNKHVSN